MPCPRQILALAILACYVAQVLGGQAAHLWQCSAKACCAAVEEDATDRPLQHHLKTSHCCHHSQQEVEHPERDHHSTPGEHRHDSSTCRVCQVLGQAQEPPTELEQPILSSPLSDTVVLVDEIYLSLEQFAFHSRGPPLDA